MNTTARTWRQRLMPLTILGVLTVFTCLFQACTSCENQLGFSDAASVAVQESGGDGRPIDSKPQSGTYYHFVPGLKCNDVTLHAGTIEVMDATIRVRDVDQRDCSVLAPRVISLTDLQWSALNPAYIGLGSGIYKRVVLPAAADLPGFVAALPMAEAWCRLRRNDFSLDVVIEQNRATRELVAKVTTAKAAEQRSVSRQGSAGGIEYSITGLSLTINRQQPSTPGTFAGHLASLDGSLVNGMSLDDAVECRTGADFDSVLPTSPSFALNLSGAALPGSVQLTRAGTGTSFGPNGSVVTAGDNVARFDFDPVSGQARGLLLEEARTNLLTQSMDLAGSAWIFSGMTVTKDGQLVGLDRFRVTGNDPTATQMWGRVAQQIGIVTGQTYSLSFFAAKGNQNFARIFVWYGPGSEANIDFDLNAGTSVVSLQSVISVRSVTMDPVVGGYRVSVVFDSSASGQIDVGIGPRSITLGDYIYATGAQLETGRMASSYIPTQQTAVSRGEDQLSVNNLNWFRSDRGHMNLAFTPLSSSTSGSEQLFSLSGGGSDAYAVEVAPGALYSASMKVGSGSASWSAAVPGKLGSLQSQLLSLTYGVASSLTLNGVTQNAPSPVPLGLVPTGLTFGGSAGARWSGYLHEFNFWPE